MSFIKDKYTKSRGGYSRLLSITCNSCGNKIAQYQKDGPGILKRMYLDRILNPKLQGKILSCSKCKELLGVLYIYKKEKRPAYKLFVGTVSKKMIKNK